MSIVLRWILKYRNWPIIIFLPSMQNELSLLVVLFYSIDNVPLIYICGFFDSVIWYRSNSVSATNSNYYEYINILYTVFVEKDSSQIFYIKSKWHFKIWLEWPGGRLSHWGSRWKVYGTAPWIPNTKVSCLKSSLGRLWRGTGVKRKLKFTFDKADLLKL